MTNDKWLMANCQWLFRNSESQNWGSEFFYSLIFASCLKIFNFADVLQLFNLQTDSVTDNQNVRAYF